MVVRQMQSRRKNWFNLWWNNLDDIYSSLNSMIENQKYLELGKNAKEYLLNFLENNFRRIQKFLFNISVKSSFINMPKNY